MFAVDAHRLARRMTARFGIGLSGGSVSLDGGDYCCVRPDDIVAPNGFCIVVARTPKRVEAVFQPDNYAGSLLRQMSEADEDARAAFAVLARGGVGAGLRLYVAIDGKMVLDPAALPPGPWRRFEIDADVIIAPGRHPPEFVDDVVLRVASACLGLGLVLLPVQELADGEAGLPEGAKVRVEVNRYERSPVNRAACIAHHGTRCLVCGFDFHAVYGELGEGYIEVHHHVPVSAMGGAYRVDPVDDLSPVCANCHAMLHRQDPPLAVSELREQFREHLSGR